MSGRCQFPRRGGNYSYRSNTAGYPRGDRDSVRAYEYQQRTRPPPQNWADYPVYEERPESQQYRQNRNKARADKFREKKKEAKQQAEPRLPKPPPQLESASSEDAPLDAPLYDMTPFSAGTPLNQEYFQNFDFSGFPPPYVRKLIRS